MRDDFEQLPPLSDVGLDRRESILSAAKLHARRRRARRVALRSAGVTILLSTTAGSLFWTLRSTRPAIEEPRLPVIARHDTPTVDHAPASQPTTREEPAIAYQHFAFTAIQTKDSIPSAVIIRTQKEDIARLSDDQLLDSLHRVGVDAGLATMGSQSLLVLNDTFPRDQTR